MNAIIIGGDDRMIEIKNFLQSKKYIVDTYNENVNISNYDIIIFPVNGVLNNYQINDKIILNEDFLLNSKENALIFSGISTESLEKMLNKASRKCIYLMKDNDVILKNIIPTVEGIVAQIVFDTKITISDANILIIGYGNVGKYLEKVLSAMGANVTLMIKTQKEHDDILNIPNFYYDNYNLLRCYLRHFDIIVNTAPEHTLDHYINFLKEDVYVLDISSYPYGINEELFKNNNINAKILKGIPGKVAPLTAGKILSKSICKHIGG